MTFLLERSIIRYVGVGRFARLHRRKQFAQGHQRLRRNHGRPHLIGRADEFGHPCRYADQFPTGQFTTKEIGARSLVSPPNIKRQPVRAMPSVVYSYRFVCIMLPTSAREVRAHQAQLLFAAGNPEVDAAPVWRKV